MKPTGITVNVRAKIEVPDETVARCLKLLEMWSDDNPDKTIEGERVATVDGIKTYYRIVDRVSRNPLEEMIERKEK
jgi:hypothetical protein